VNIDNKKARFDYDVISSYEAGISLTGSEVKSIRTGGAVFSGARVVVIEGEAFLIGLNIQKYKFDNREDFEPGRTRRLLLHKKEVLEILTKSKAAGLTLVPMKLYNKGGLVKVQIALVRGKKKFEKREVLKKRDTEMGLARRLKTSR